MDSSLLLHGLNLGYALCTLALTALGLAIVFGLLRVLNMAHGEFVMLGAYCAVVVQDLRLPTLAAVLLSLVLAVFVCGLLGWVVERWLIRPLYRRSFDTLLATWALAMLMRKLVEAVFGRQYRNVESTLTRPLDVFGLPYPAWRLLLMALVVLLLTTLFVWYRRSTVGLRLRAMTANPLLAQSLGIPTQKLAAQAFMVGVALAGVSGVLLAPLIRIEPGIGVDYLLDAFFVLIVGGPGTLAGLLGGVGLIGASDSLVSSLVSQTSGYATVLVLSILFLWLKPDGLFARR